MIFFSEFLTLIESHVYIATLFKWILFDVFLLVKKCYEAIIASNYLMRKRRIIIYRSRYD